MYHYLTHLYGVVITCATGLLVSAHESRHVPYYVSSIHECSYIGRNAVVTHLTV